SSWGLKNAANNDKISAVVAWNAQKACLNLLSGFFLWLFSVVYCELPRGNTLFSIRRNTYDVQLQSRFQYAAYAVEKA
ncbi:MAG: hypothetical protein IKZ82_00055, partial [Clostridia bacterium]|nr:hypothetical protein [Clostridia bacterium]